MCTAIEETLARERTIWDAATGSFCASPPETLTARDYVALAIAMPFVAVKALNAARNACDGSIATVFIDRGLGEWSGVRRILDTYARKFPDDWNMPVIQSLLGSCTASRDAYSISFALWLIDHADPHDNMFLTRASTIAAIARIGDVRVTEAFVNKYARSFGADYLYFWVIVHALERRNTAFASQVAKLFSVRFDKLLELAPAINQYALYKLIVFIASEYGITAQYLRDAHPLLLNKYGARGCGTSHESIAVMLISELRIPTSDLVDEHGANDCSHWSEDAWFAASRNRA